MQFVPITKVSVSHNRQRQEFDPDALQELKNSIEDRGLMHPVVVRPDGEAWILVAGERRLRAIKEIWELSGGFCCGGVRVPLDCVPIVSLGDLSPLEAEEAELDENLRRRDLTWQETADAHARLHALRKEQARLGLYGPLDENNIPTGVHTIVHTIADTAQEIHGRSDGWFQNTVRKELIVARHLDNPEVAKAKSLDDAFKVLKRQEDARKNRDLAAIVGATFSSDLHELHNRDCLDFLSFDERGRFDVILTDPPYGMDADQFSDAGGKLTGITHQYRDDYNTWRDLMVKFSVLSFHAAKPQAHAYIFCDLDRYHELKAMMETAGWYVHRTPLIVFKQNSGRVPLPDRGPRRQWEMVLYAIKGNRPTTHIYPDVIPCTADENTSHGAQKPVALFQNLLQRSVQPGNVVFDGFAGSGTIFEAAHKMQCQAIACELNPEYYGIGLRRLQALKANEAMELF